MSYYLPTTLKILRAYAQLEDQEVEGENISAAMERIENMMDKVVEGFEKQLDQLFQGDALDITADVEVLERMLADGFAIGGEQSGHTIFRAYATTGDGELTALQFLQTLRHSGVPASQLAARCPQYPQELINVEVPHTPGVKERIMADESLRQETRRWEEKLGGQGRILIRPSGTEALIRVMVEAKTTEIAHQVASVLADFIKKL